VWRGPPPPLDRRLQCEAVHHGGEHAHGVAGRTRHAARRYFHAADNVATADHDGNFTAQLAGRDQIAGDSVDGRLIDAEGLRAGEVFARKLDHHTTIERLSHDAIAFPTPARAAPGANGPDGLFRRLFLAAGRRDFGGEIGF